MNLQSHDALEVGAIVGQMAGALYGWQRIKSEEFSSRCAARMQMLNWAPPPQVATPPPNHITRSYCLIIGKGTVLDLPKAQTRNS